MASPPLPRTVLASALAAGAAFAVTPAAAIAKLIPPPGPWPTTVTGATNPLAGTPFAFNGGQATPNADLRVWLPFHGHRLTSITRTVGQKIVVRGQLRNRDNHHSIAGATVTLVAQNNVYAADWATVADVRTNRRGDFRAVLPPGYHRRAAVIYYPSIDAAAPVFSRRLLVRAKSRVDLARPFHNGRSYRFDGRVSAGALPAPASGLLVALQVRNRSGNWVTARLRRTSASGRFRIRYRFPTRAALTVRVSVPSQTGWALYAGLSHTRAIRP